MMNPFEHHGIKHLSASSINLFAAEPALWVMKYVHGIKDRVGAAAHRGSATEEGIEAGLFDPDMSVADCVKIAEYSFDRKTALSGDPKREKERDGLAGLVETGLKELRQYGIPAKPDDGRQHKIMLNVDELPVPIIGYLDFDFPQHGLLVDLKTQRRLTSQINPSHARQGAIYQAARGNNYEVRFAYTTPKKIGVYRLEDGDQHLAAVINIAKRIERFLAVSQDKHELAGIVAPNFENFYWNEATTRAAGKELFGY